MSHGLSGRGGARDADGAPVEHGGGNGAGARGGPASTPAPDTVQLAAATLLLGLGAVPLMLELKPQVGLFVIALLLLSGAALRWPRLQPGRWLLVLLTLLGGVNVLDAYHSLVGQYPGSALLLTMLALKRLESRTRRDLRVMLVVFGFLLVIQFLFGDSPWLAIWMVLMLVAAVALLADLTIRNRAQEVRARWQRAGRTALVLSVQAAPLALVLFVFFPRLDAPLWDLGLNNEQGVTGLKDWLEPGSISELVVSGEDAFRVRFDDGPRLRADQLYWRGPVLWHTDGRRWVPRYAADANAERRSPGAGTDAGPSAGPSAGMGAGASNGFGPDSDTGPNARTRVQERAAPSPESRSGTESRPSASQGPMPVRTPLSEPIGYTVLLEPTDQRWLFALELPAQLPDRARLTPDFQVLAAKPVTDLRLYRASSVLDYRLAGLAPAHRAAALQLPQNVTERMRRLVAGWREQARGDAELVQQALAFFNRSPFRYTLLPPKLGANPADAFLFETQAGFCEHYASSFVLLMRVAGIPARIVLGYLGGEYNPLSGDYLVRQSDAHAWAEVWLDGSGWTRVDPTAAVASERVERDPRLTALGRSAPVRFRLDDSGLLAQALRGARFIAGALDSGWKNWVLGFSSADQFRLLDALGLGRWREYGLAVLMMAAGAAVMLGWAVALTRTTRARDPIKRCWDRFGKRLGRIGLAPQHHEGPLHYRERVLAARPDLHEPVNAIVEQYLRLRFRPEAGRADHRRLCRLVQGFRPQRTPPASAKNDGSPSPRPR